VSTTVCDGAFVRSLKRAVFYTGSVKRNLQVECRKQGRRLPENSYLLGTRDAWYAAHRLVIRQYLDARRGSTRG